MKTLNQMRYFLFALIAVLTISCSSDDDDKNSVKYRVVSESGILTGVQYRAASGEMTNGFTATDDDWSKTVNFTPPFSATMTATFSNPANTAAEYTLEIYRDGTLTQVVPGIVPSGADVTDSITLEISE